MDVQDEAKEELGQKDADADVDVLGQQLVLWLLRWLMLLVEGVNRKSMAVQMEGMMYAVVVCQVEKLCTSASQLYRICGQDTASC